MLEGHASSFCQVLSCCFFSNETCYLSCSWHLVNLLNYISLSLSFFLSFFFSPRLSLHVTFISCWNHNKVRIFFLKGGGGRVVKTRPPNTIATALHSQSSVPQSQSILPPPPPKQKLENQYMLL